MQDWETGLILTPQEFLTLDNIRNRVFEHTKVFDPLLLKKTGMDEEFNTVFTTMGWENFWKLADHPGSTILTLEFLSTVKPSINHIYFCLMGQEYNLTWPNFSHILGFAPNCTPELEYATHRFNMLQFWQEITGNNECCYPRTNDIHNPTLCFMHRWIGITLFPRDDVRIVREIDLRLLFAMVNKIHV